MSRKRVVLEFDPETSGIFDASGVLICTWVGLQFFEEIEQTTNTSKIDEFIKLKNAGFNADEILKLTN